jgi:hypothetical protein
MNYDKTFTVSDEDARVKVLKGLTVEEKEKGE